LPLLKGCSSSLSNNNDDLCSLREELLWKNKTSDLDLSMYLQAARSIAAFARMCDRGLADDMYEVAQRDETTIYALTTLHNHDYDRTRAIEALVQCPIPKKIDRKWSDDDQKKFIKGLRQYGKNFFRIRKDLLPHKQTSDLVEYYYLWKKTPQAQSNRPRRRQRPCSTSANLSITPTPVKQRNTKNNNKDESEHNSDNDDNQTTTDSDEQYCRHCQTTSKDLQTAGRDNQLLCYDCRMFYKKYGELPILDSESSPYLFKPLNETSSSKRKRTKPSQSPDDNNSSSTRSKKKNRSNEKLSTIEEDDISTIKTEIKLEEQENEKPSPSTTTMINSSLHIKTEDLNSTLHTPTPCKQELHSPKILNDHTKQNNPNLLLSSPSSAFSRTSKKSLIPKIFDEYDSLSKHNTIHSTMLSGDVTPIMSSKDNNDLSNDDGNTSDSSTNANQELICDEGPTPITCDRG
jgi:arginine-glutamic acid dipeptide repeat-containing protein